MRSRRVTAGHGDPGERAGGRAGERARGPASQDLNDCREILNDYRACFNVRRVDDFQLHLKVPEMVELKSVFKTREPVLVIFELKLETAQTKTNVSLIEKAAHYCETEPGKRTLMLPMSSQRDETTDISIEYCLSNVSDSISIL